ncbi:hypothetical protein Sya03_14040 [Spirilliplanes yamanashiensis]|uniref:Uncharacterized protein n=2 Tax=Spirilliplanes yamanashiensis TaxID=42233 RepID=A0A8J4DHE1_9ACTN|nr:hypothetical protein Sya03_14040 [Spirilliplanes yamanashiensis]
MGLIRPSVLLLALAMASPALYQYLVAQDLDLAETLARYLIAVPIAAIMLALFRMVTAGYGREKRALTLQNAQPPAPPVVEPEPLSAPPN